MKLTQREMSALMALSWGHSYKSGAILLGVKPTTFAEHAKSLYRKLDARTAQGAVGKAFREGIIQ